MFNQKEYLKKYKLKNKKKLKAKRNEYERNLRKKGDERYYKKRRKLDRNREKRETEELSDRYIKHFPEFRGRKPSSQMIELKRTIITLKRETHEKQQRAVRSTSKNT